MLQVGLLENDRFGSPLGNSINVRAPLPRGSPAVGCLCSSNGMGTPPLVATVSDLIWPWSASVWTARELSRRALSRVQSEISRNTPISECFCEDCPAQIMICVNGIASDGLLSASPPPGTGRCGPECRRWRAVPGREVLRQWAALRHDLSELSARILGQPA